MKLRRKVFNYQLRLKINFERDITLSHFNPIIPRKTRETDKNNVHAEHKNKRKIYMYIILNLILNQIFVMY